MEKFGTEKEAVSKLDLHNLLQCCACKKPLKNPQTLQQCLHSYCKTCLQTIPKTEQDEKQGWVCVVCKSFSHGDKIRDNEFIQDLMGVLNTTEETKGKSIACKLCEKDDKVTKKCIDCKIELCDHCQVGHLKIPGLQHHQITEITQDDIKVLDKVVYCKLHPNKPIEYNCIPCESPTCAPCNWTTHKHHDIETVSEAIERILPELQTNITAVESNLRIIEKQIDAITSKIEETKDNYCKVRRDMDDQLEKVINRLKAVKAKKEEEVNAEESQALDTLTNIKQKLENQQSKLKNVTSYAKMTTEKAQDTTLMNEIQNSVAHNLRELSKDEKQEECFEIPHPCFEPQEKLNYNKTFE